MRMFIFILLGAQVDFALMGQYWLGGVAVVVMFMLVARPVTVFVCALPDRRARWRIEGDAVHVLDARDRRDPRGARRPLLGINAPDAKVMASVTFVAILMTILIQAPTTRWLAGKLRVAGKGQHGAAFPARGEPCARYAARNNIVRKSAMTAPTRKVVHADIKPENPPERAAHSWTPHAWEATEFPGIQIKVLYTDDNGVTTALFKLAPGAVVPS